MSTTNMLDKIKEADTPTAEIGTPSQVLDPNNGNPYLSSLCNGTS